MRASLFACLLALAVPFGAQAEPAAWDDYQVIMWQPQTEQAYAALARHGVTGAALVPDRASGDNPATAARAASAATQAGLRPYLENIATDFYAPYHRWQPGRPVNALFVQTLASWHANPDDP
ncbi:MAG: hypothetical protein JOY70_00285, partial [Acidisphaera sp.]|nr:hypothetical protein [Acidisphaera sp.]